jgi:acetyl esterase
MPAKTEVDMFFKSKAPEKDKNPAANTAEVIPLCSDAASGPRLGYETRNNPSPRPREARRRRRAKLNARALKTRAELVGLSGQSSGGHLAMLVAMRPRDARYAAIPLPAGSSAQDATVGCVLMSWPVINPLSRYRHAKRALAGTNPPEWPKSIIPRQDGYWRSEANMAEGDPMLALERGEKVETPPTVWFQGRGDALHDYKDADASFPGNEPQRFVANYRKAGGEIALEYIDAERHAGHSPDLSKTGDMFERMVVFVHRHIKVRI